MGGPPCLRCGCGVRANEQYLLGTPIKGVAEGRWLALTRWHTAH